MLLIKISIVLLLGLGSVMKVKRGSISGGLRSKSLCSNWTMGPPSILSLSFLDGDVSNFLFDKFPF